MSSTSDICIYRTGQLWEADLVCATFDEQGIPYYRRAETSGGLVTAMPLAAAPGVGVWFTIWVPREAADRARAAFAHLPLEEDHAPDVLDLRPSLRGRRLLTVAASVLLFMFLLGSVRQCGRGLATLGRGVSTNPR